MKFQKLINDDMERIGCTLSELSRASGLSAAVLSRYRSGEREPGERGEEHVLLLYKMSVCFRESTDVGTLS